MPVTTSELPSVPQQAAGESALARIDETAHLIDKELDQTRSATSPPVEVQVLSVRDDRAWNPHDGSGPLWDEWLALWNGLDESERDAASHPAWITAWLRAYALPQQRDVRLFVCRCSDRLLAVLPFEVSSSRSPLGRICQLRLPAEVPLEGASLALPAAEARRIFRALFSLVLPDAGRPAVLTFGEVDQTHALLRLAGLRRTVEEIDSRSVIDIGRGYDQLLADVGGNFRGNLRKARNKLEKLVVVRLDEITSADDIPQGIARYTDVSRRSWKAAEQTDLASDPAMHEFYSFALPRLAQSGQAVVHVLQASGVDLAAQLSLRFGDRLDVHKISFDERYADMSPGNLLLERVMREAAPRRGIARVNLVTHLDWHARWKPSLIRTYRVRIFAPGLQGLWARAHSTSPRTLLRSGLARLGWLEPLRRTRNRLLKRPRSPSAVPTSL